MKIWSILFSAILLAVISCAPTKEILEDREIHEIILTQEQIDAAIKADLELDLLRRLIYNPIYKYSPREVDDYLKYLHFYEPDLRKRIQLIAKKNIGQKYEMYLLGEYPFEIYDDQPLYCLDRSDCVVFSEHTYAMAFSNNWKTFFAMLQRIRYKDGIISYTTRNHYTEADWDVNNSWFLKDITDEIAQGKSIQVMSKIDRAAFFKKYNIGQNVPVENLIWSYIPAEEIPNVLHHLKTGDFVNVVRGFSPTDVYVGHTGIISVEEDGTVNFIHSTDPEVKIQTLMNYQEASLSLNEKRIIENEVVNKKNEEIKKYNLELRIKNNGLPHPNEKKLLAKKPYFYGFKFLRLRENVWENLRAIDGPNAPKVTIYGTLD
ncbi:MAG: DUF1460 domain-containing protein [Ignavibacteria bacterium]|nr:DUF1460 domain-containing protein [Ignavibacteria bacterium]